MSRCHFALTGGVAVALIVGCGSVTSNPDGAGGAGGAGGGIAGTSGSGGGAAGTTGSGGTGNNVCTFTATYVIRDGGGLVAMADTATLAPPAAFHYVRDFFRQDAGQQSCDPPMPPCTDPTKIDVYDVEVAIAHADVQAALAMTTVPFYGNRGVADGPNFNFMRGDRGFNAGLNCDTPSTTCTPIPAGINALVQRLRDLIRQQRMDPSCAAIVN